MVKRIVVKAGERKRIIHRLFSSIATTYRFSAEPLAPGEPLSGTVEVNGSRWLFPRAPVRQPLVAHNSVEKGFWDTLYRVEIIPDHDTVITRVGTTYPGIMTLIGIALLITALAAAVALLVGA